MVLKWNPDLAVVLGFASHENVLQFFPLNTTDRLFILFSWQIFLDITKSFLEFYEIFQLCLILLI